MRRADRLFQIIQVLRRSSRPITATMLASELEVTVRTIYRDVADLLAQRVPIRGETGIGYVLDRVYDMPPLMLSTDEVEAAVLGAQWVADRGDPVLARAARNLLAKIAAVVPDHLRPFIAEPSIGAAPRRTASLDGLDMARLRAAIRTGCKLRIRYRDEAGRASERVVWPVLVGYADTVRLLAAWCEWRQAFRHFRTDRIETAAFLDERFERSPGDLRRDWKRQFEAERGVRLPRRGGYRLSCCSRGSACTSRRGEEGFAVALLLEQQPNERLLSNMAQGTHNGEAGSKTAREMQPQQPGCRALPRPRASMA